MHCRYINTDINIAMAILFRGLRTLIVVELLICSCVERTILPIISLQIVEQATRTCILSQLICARVSSISIQGPWRVPALNYKTQGPPPQDATEC
jgi:hypothetical protein